MNPEPGTLHDSNGPSVVFFDGVCGLCNRLVDLLLRIDKNQHFKFAPLQGETARHMLGDLASDDLKTVILLKGGKVFTRSNAVIEIFQTVGGFWRLVVVFKVFPVRMRDRVYRWIARNRYRWFGQRESCRVPSAEERERILT